MLLRRLWQWLTEPRGRIPQIEIYPDVRRPKKELHRLNRYVGMPVAVVYRTKNSSPKGSERVIKGMIVGVRHNPPRLALSTFGEVVMFDLDRVAAVTVIHEETE